MKRTKTFEIEIKEKIVREGGSAVYESWHKVCDTTTQRPPQSHSHSHQAPRCR